MLIALTLASLLAAAPQARPVKVFISADMEGINGVIAGDQTSAQGAEYGRARKLMVEEVNRAIEGALAAGTTEILVNDSHGTMRNLLLEDLRPPARLLSNSFKPNGMMQGLDESFAAVFFIGYHARAGSPAGVLAHTGSSALADVKINGTRVGEAGMNILYAASFGVPVALITGDQVAVAQAREMAPGIEAVEVKEAIGTRAVIYRPLEESRQAIREAAARAVRKLRELRPPALSPPFTFEVTFSGTAQADIAEQVPTVKRAGSHAVSYTTSDFRAGYRLLRVLYRYLNPD